MISLASSPRPLLLRFTIATRRKTRLITLRTYSGYSGKHCDYFNDTGDYQGSHESRKHKFKSQLLFVISLEKS